MRWLKRRTEGFNLAFLDVMSCGLGAVILIFMLVKYQSEEPDTASNALQAELADRQNKNDAIESHNNAQSAHIEKQKQKLQQQLKSVTQKDEQTSTTASEIIKLAKEIARLEQKKIQLKQKNTAVSVGKTREQRTHDDHLLGLRVTGERILILLDNSASMTDERLADIIKIKVANTTAKKGAPKWQRAIAIVQWIIDRVPDKSAYMIINYNAKAEFLPARKWIPGNDRAASANAFQALEKLYPQAATNLHAALALVKTSAIAPTDIYVITDGLPTKGAKKCSFFASKTTVSGKCRLQLFESAVRSFSGSARVNTVLLPIEGDPDAAFAYWQWAIATGGLMISPAESWP